MTWAWIALAVMAIGYGTANVLQAIAATRDKADESLQLGLLWRLARQKTYLAGVAFQGLGTVMAFIARRDLPLFLVQAAVGAGIVVTAVLGVVFLRWKMPRAEIVLISVVLAGILILILAASPGPAHNVSLLGETVLAGTVVVWAVGAHFAARLHGAAGAVTLGGIAGAAYGTAAIASRPLAGADSWGEFFTSPLLYIFIVHIVAGQLFIGMALQRGATTAASAAMNMMAIVPPAVVGLIFLGDHIREGWRIQAAFGLLITVTATVALGWYASPQSHSRRKSGNSTAVRKLKTPEVQQETSQ